MEKKRVLVVGAGGFAGGFIVEEGLRRGYEVWAGVRESTSRKYLTDPRIKFITFDFEADADTLTDTLIDNTTDTLTDTSIDNSTDSQIDNSIDNSTDTQIGGWDYIVYNLGATKCLRFSDFSHINCDYLDKFIKELKGFAEKGGKLPEKILYMSSLSAAGPVAERDGHAIKETDLPSPNTRYGASKLKAEMIMQMSGLPFIILRATGIYGPRDKDYFLMFKSIKERFDFSVGFKAQQLTFLYVEDLARAIYDALEKAPTGETYNVSHPQAYTQAQFRRIAARVMGKKFVMPVRVPLWGLKIVSAIAEKVGAAKGKPSTLNRDKYNIMAQRNWRVNVSKAEHDFGFRPQVDLEEGIRKSIEWYREEGWL